MVKIYATIVKDYKTYHYSNKVLELLKQSSLNMKPVRKRTALHSAVYPEKYIATCKTVSSPP